MSKLVMAALAVLGLGVLEADKASAQFGGRGGRGSGVSIGIGTGGFNNGFGPGGFNNGYGRGYGNGLNVGGVTIGAGAYQGYGSYGPGYPYGPGFANNGLYGPGGFGNRPGWYSPYAPLGYQSGRNVGVAFGSGNGFYNGGPGNSYGFPSSGYVSPMVGTVGSPTYVAPSMQMVQPAGGAVLPSGTVMMPSSEGGSYTVEANENGQFVAKGTFTDLAQAARLQDELKAKNVETKIVKR